MIAALWRGLHVEHPALGALARIGLILILRIYLASSAAALKDGRMEWIKAIDDCSLSFGI
jgi:hypothetical protein